MSRMHEIMIEQGDNWAIVNLRDKGEGTEKSAVGTWRKTTSKTSDDSTLTFTSSANEYLAWNWLSESPGVLLIGVESDQSKSSHKTGDGKWLQVLITLSGIKKLAGGKFAGGGGNGGRGKLTYGHSPLFKAGEIGWTVVRYES